MQTAERVSRRHFVLGATACAAIPADLPREVFLRSPGKGTAVMAMAYYTRKSGGEMISIEERWSRSDTIDVAFLRRSSDYGKTWSAPVERKTGERVANGMLRRHLRGGWVDPRNGRLVDVWVEGILPTDDPLEGSRQWNVYYTISENGGRTNSGVRQVIHRGVEFDAKHPLPHVWTGKNSVMLGDRTCQPILGHDGAILVPAVIAPLGPDGKLSNPGGGYTYHDAAILLGRWRGRDLEWEMSEVLKADPSRATRGLDEPTLARLTRGRLLMVLRGSNDRKPELPSYRWVSMSSDGGRRWTTPQPWTYTDGTPFFSPSACSQLLHHSNGKLYWLGNITPENPRGNRPRYPFVIGEVDQDSGLLIRNSVRIVDDKGPQENPLLTLSNFYAREDRGSKAVALHMTRLFALPDGWEGDAFLYQIPVG